MNYISIQSSKDVIEHYGIKGMRWGIKSRHADLRDNHIAYKNLKRKVKSIQKDLRKQYGKSNDPGYTKWRMKHKLKAAKRYNQAEEVRRAAQEAYELNGRKITPGLEKANTKYNMLMRESRAHNTAYNTDPHDYVRNKSSYDKYNVRKEVKNAFRREGKIK